MYLPLSHFGEPAVPTNAAQLVVFRLPVARQEEALLEGPVAVAAVGDELRNPARHEAVDLVHDHL